MKKLFSLILILFCTQLAYADDYAITEGAGRTVAADEISSKIYPRLKLIYGADGTNSGDVSLTNPFPIQDVATGSTGWSVAPLVSANTINATSVKGSAGALGGWVISNRNASVRYLKIYNKATAPDPSTDTPALIVEIPGNTSGILSNVEFNKGIYFNLGIGYVLVTGIGTTDATAVAANELIINILYK